MDFLIISLLCGKWINEQEEKYDFVAKGIWSSKLHWKRNHLLMNLSNLGKMKHIAFPVPSWGKVPHLFLLSSLFFLHLFKGQVRGMITFRLCLHFVVMVSLLHSEMCRAYKTFEDCLLKQLLNWKYRELCASKARFCESSFLLTVKSWWSVLSRSSRHGSVFISKYWGHSPSYYY